MFTKSDYDCMHARVFKDDYPGYKPSVKEIPNGDGKVDADKKYAHIAPKYWEGLPLDDRKMDLVGYYGYAHDCAVEAAKAAGIPREFWPDWRYGALRILDYPSGSVSNGHFDFDLFTLMCYRDQPDKFYVQESTYGSDAIHAIRQINPQAHLGLLGEEIGLGHATFHSVLPSETRQCSIVHFSIPNHDAVLPSGVTVRDFLNERMARSRTEFKAYE